MTHRYQLLLALAVFATACEGVLDPPNGLDHAIAAPTCGPADESYVAVFLADEPIDGFAPRAPYLQIQVPIGFAYLRKGQTWEIGEYPAGSTAWYAENETSSFLLTASSGEIRISSVSSNEIEGTINLRFPNGLRLRGSFEAVWRDRQTFCG